LNLGGVVTLEAAMSSPANPSLIKYDSAQLVTAVKDKKTKKAKGGNLPSIQQSKGQLSQTQTEDILNSILPPRYQIYLFLNSAIGRRSCGGYLYLFFKQRVERRCTSLGSVRFLNPSHTIGCYQLAGNEN